MLTQIINGRILTPQGWLKDGSVLICDGKILEVTNSDLADACFGAWFVTALQFFLYFDSFFFQQGFDNRQDLANAT